MIESRQKWKARTFPLVYLVGMFNLLIGGEDVLQQDCRTSGISPADTEVSLRYS